ncbi:MAG: glucuronate isomerase [Planctomycetes bacterium]|nr:glucuronate isomerase [Planctomycetota bacterium]
MLHPDRFFDPDPQIREVARDLYAMVRDLPLICPHGHVDPAILAENRPFPDPAELIIIPDHYVFRMLYSQGIPLERLGIPRGDGRPVETDHRAIWQLFAENFHLFRGTPSRCWLEHELVEVFGIEEPLCAATGQAIYDDISEKLRSEEFLPRSLFEKFRIEVLCTTDSASDRLEHHRAIRDSGWKGVVRPTFRPDAAVDIAGTGWREEIERLEQVTGKEIASYRDFVAALESRRESFRSMGATATDHGVASPRTLQLSRWEVEGIFLRALRGDASEADGELFTAHMLMESARMSVDDGLVMQLHPGCFRNHNPLIFEAFGRDKGADIPLATEYTRNLQPLLAAYGNHANLTLVVFTLDESTLSRELAPLAGHYPAMRLGPAWWFHDSREGMTRYRRRVTETAGIYNTAGFNDDTRAFPSIPARHDLCRRVDANFLAGLVAEHVIDRRDAEEMIVDLSYGLAKKTYRL